MPQISDGNKGDLQAMAKSLIEGKLVAIPTETVYGIAADAMNKHAVQRIYEVKGRPKNHPVIVHISKKELLDFWAEKIPKFVNKLINEFWPGPLTIILRRSKNAGDWLTGGQNTIGLRMPNHKKTLELLEEFHHRGGKGLAAPSANKFGRVSPTSLADVISDIGMKLKNSDWVLDGGKCEIGLESTIVDCIQGNLRILRPGVITKKMIENLCGATSVVTQLSKTKPKIRVPGLLDRHYSPRASVRIADSCYPGEGFLALREIKTPSGAIRLGSPDSVEAFAQNLYEAFRIADKLRIRKIVVNVPKRGGLSDAIFDRVTRASNSDL